MSKYSDIIDAVNDAESAEEAELALAYLNGYRKALDNHGIHWSTEHDDLHTRTRFAYRDERKPMYCGVILREWIA